MDDLNLNWVRAFLAVYEYESFSLAGDVLGVPRSTVSRSVAALEKSLGTTLFHRSTRRVVRTPAGRLFFERVAIPFRALNTAISEMPSFSEIDKGSVTIGAPVDVGVELLAKPLATFMRRFPTINLDLRLAHETRDLKDAGLDISLRVMDVDVVGDELWTKPLQELEVHVYAAPKYLSEHGCPEHPSELDGHIWATYQGNPGVLESAFGPFSLKFAPRLLASDMYYLRQTLCSGGAIGTLPTFLARTQLAEGKLVRVLPKWSMDCGNLTLVCQRSDDNAVHTNIVRDYLIDALGQKTD